MMEKFAQILQRLPTGGTFTSNTSTNRSATSWTNPVPSSQEFSPQWGNLTQWRPLLPKEGGLIQVDIGGHPPIPFGPATSILAAFHFQQLTIFSRFSGPALSEP